MRHRTTPERVRSTPGGTAAAESADPVVATGGPRPGHRYDVEGLRAVAILLVAGFHVWGQGRVSGGVDVFLLISGFFVGGGLLRRVGGGGPFALGAYVAKLGRRLVPPLLLALAAVVVGTWLWLPRSEWSDVSGGVLASATYVENWRMALAGQAYAAADPMSSPVQHIWSLSVQGQLFVVLPLLLLAIRFVLRRAGLGVDAARRGLVAAVAVLAAASFAWAIVGVQTNQNVAYFDTGARAWEYLAGTLVAAAATAIRLPRVAALALGWVGLAMILATGIAVDARATFPGPEALLPIGGAVLVLVAGLGAGAGRGPAVGRVLGWRPLAAAGGYAYEYYLWHWVVLVMALAATGRESFGWLAGSVVLVVSGVVAWVARRVTDALSGGGARRRIVTVAPRVVLATCLAVALAVPSGWLGYRAANPWTGSGELDVAVHPGALTLMDPGRWPVRSDEPYVPDLVDAKADWPLAGREDCDTAGVLETDIRLCVLGDPEGAVTVALVGGSHAVTFAEPLDAVAQENGVRIEGYFKQGCPLARWGVGDFDPETQSCADWNEAVLQHVVDLGVTGVITTGTRSGFELPDWEDGDYLPGPYADSWEWLTERGVGVAAIRDNPWFPGDPLACVDREGATSDECAVARDVALGDNPLPDAISADGYATIDLSDLMCDDELCRPVVGNVLAYIDDNHLTATFARTLAPAMAQELRGVPWWP